MANDPMTLATRAFNAPLMLAPAKAAVIAQAFGPRFMGLDAGARIDLAGFDGTITANHRQQRPQAASLLGDEVHAHEKRTGGSYSVIGGVAVITATGTLVRRGSHLGESSGVTSYEGISAMVRAAASDPMVKAIALEVDSFGGEAAGIFDLAQQLREAREIKPVHAFIADYALSAGYAIASQADHITVPPFGEAGSIGVVCMHVDYEQAMNKDGVKVTLIHSGAHKVDGNPFQALPEAVRKDLQRSNDEMWSGFAHLVEAGRKGRISAQAALKTEARVFRGAQAVQAGLADDVAEARTAFQSFVAQMNSDFAPSARAAAASTSTSDVAQVLRMDLPPLAAIRDSAPAAKSFRASAVPGIGSPGCNIGAHAPQPKETGMSKDVIEPGADTQPDKNTPSIEATPEAKVQRDGAARADAAMQAERERAAKISAKAEQAGVSASLAQKLIADGTPLAEAYEAILDAKADAAQDGGDIRNTHGGARVTSDARDRATQGITKALLAKAGLAGGERNEFTGMSLREMARHSLGVQGISIPQGGVLAMASAAFAPAAASGGMHSTSDFTNILVDVANKAMLKGFEEAPETFERFTSVGTMTDFKATRRVGLDAFPSLLKVEEGAEFKHGTLGDHGETAMLATYGRLFAITRQTIINDDLDAFTKIPGRMGRAARRTVGDLVFAVLSTNAAMSDSVALFHATHKNLAGTGAVPSESSINARITAMATQTDRSGNAVLNIGPKFLLAPPKHRSAVLQALNSEYAPDDTDKVGSSKMSKAYNTVRDAAEPIFDARITGNEWYLLADPNVYDTIEVGYLDGITTPYLDQQDGWSVDGTEFKVRIDASATALAYQGMQKDPGA